MDKINMMMYVNLMNKYEENTKLDITMVFSPEEKILLKNMKEAALKDDELKEFLNTLTNMTPEEREFAVKRRYQENNGYIKLQEIKDYNDVVINMTKEEQNKLNNLINNYSELNMQGINLEKLTYLDAEGNEKSISEPKRETKKAIEKSFEEPLRMAKQTSKPIKKEPKKQEKGLIKALVLFLITGILGGVSATILTLILSK